MFIKPVTVDIVEQNTYFFSSTKSWPHNLLDRHFENKSDYVNYIETRGIKLNGVAKKKQGLSSLICILCSRAVQHMSLLSLLISQIVGE